MRSPRALEDLVRLAETIPAKKLLYVGTRTPLLDRLRDEFAGGGLIQIDPTNELTGTPLAAGQPGLRSFAQALSDEAGHDTGYVANSRTLSGLVRPEALSAYWQNAKTLEERQILVRTLDDFLDEIGEAGPGPKGVNWLVVDTLPVGRMLRGGEKLLKSLDVLAARVIVDDVVDNGLRDSSLACVSETLGRLGYYRVAVLPDRHSAFALAVFARDWKVLLGDENAKVSDELTRSNQALDQTSETLDQTKEALEQSQQALAQARLEFADLEADRIALDHELKHAREAIAQREGELNAQNKIGIELANTVKQLSQRNDALQRLADERLSSLEAARAEITALNRRQDELVDNLVKTTSRNAEVTEQINKLVSAIDSRVASVSDDVRQSRYLQFTAISGTKKAQANKLNLRADAFYKAGEVKRAAEFYQLALERDPKSAWSCQGLAEALARMDYQKDPDWAAAEEGNRIDETGRWDVTVRLYRKALGLDPEVSRRFNAAFPAKPAERTENYVESPLFVVGCGHSGTSVMVRALGHHPDVNPIPKESALFLKGDAEINKTMAEWDEEASKAGAVTWVEKTPPHIFQIDRFLKLRPGAKFVLLIRDGRDVVCSLRHRKGYEGVSDRIDRWVFDNMAGLPFWGHPNVLVVKYENFVTETKKTLSEICSFAGLETKTDLSRFHEEEAYWYSQNIRKPDAIKNNTDHVELRNWQINQPIFDGRGKWETDMSKKEKMAFKRSPAQQMLEQFEYVADDSW